MLFWLHVEEAASLLPAEFPSATGDGAARDLYLRLVRAAANGTSPLRQGRLSHGVA